jgi:hypothetical protein
MVYVISWRRSSRVHQLVSLYLTPLNTPALQFRPALGTKHSSWGEQHRSTLTITNLFLTLRTEILSTTSKLIPWRKSSITTRFPLYVDISSEGCNKCSWQLIRRVNWAISVVLGMHNAPWIVWLLAVKLIDTGGWMRKTRNVIKLNSGYVYKRTRLNVNTKTWRKMNEASKISNESFPWLF